MELKLATLVVIGTGCIGSCNPTTYDYDHDGPLMTKRKMIKNHLELR